VDVSGLRQRLSLTQEQFAARFGFSVATQRRIAGFAQRD
jgi:putative transcriptional regulator